MEIKPQFKLRNISGTTTPPRMILMLVFLIFILFFQKMKYDFHGLFTMCLLIGLPLVSRSIDKLKGELTVILERGKRSELMERFIQSIPETLRSILVLCPFYLAFRGVLFNLNDMIIWGFFVAADQLGVKFFGERWVRESWLNLFSRMESK
jgi:hypothetical protein